MTQPTFAQVRRLVDRALERAPRENRWGDRLDVRYYLASRLAQLRDKRVLDIGCGPGILLSVLDPSNQATGLDSDARAIQAAREIAPNAKLSARRWRPERQGTYDVVILANMVEAIEDPESLVRDAANALRQGGTLYLTTPNRAHPSYRQNRQADTPLPHFHDLAGLDALLKPHFNYRIHGWNPFPPYPFFPPARLLAKLPGWFGFLAGLCERGWFAREAKNFYVEALR